jgi:hypothetical protein
VLTSKEEEKMSPNRYPPKVLDYAAEIASRAYHGKPWEDDWKKLIATLFTESQDSLEEEAAKALGLPDTVPPYGCETPADLDALLETWDEKLQEVGEDAQLANVDLPNMLQKQQQTLQMMSQISKMLHDTAMAVIRNIGG